MKKKTERLFKLLEFNNLTISVAESITAGKLQDTLASISGASAHFLGGVTAYNLASKVRYFNIDKEHAKSVNCVSARVAREMADGSLKASGSSVSIATTGYAEEYGGFKPHAYISVAVHGRDTVTTKVDLAHAKSREEARLHTAQKAIEFALVQVMNAYPTKEFEYKFLPNKKMFNLEDLLDDLHETQSIRQCYLSNDKERSSRIRIIDSSEAVATTKLPNHIEIEYDIPLEAAVCIYKSYNGGLGTVEKTRHKIKFKGLVIEIDVFHGRHEGLVLIEIEVPFKEYILPSLPDWIGWDVTGDSAYSNAVIASH